MIKNFIHIVRRFIVVLGVTGMLGLAGMRPLLAKKSLENEETKKTPIHATEDKRAGLRAFYTAPPVTPHEVTDDRTQRQCLYCHQQVRHIGNRTSVQTPHPQFSSCQQCHVDGATHRDIKVENSWNGLKEPKKGIRAHAWAPPTVPHRLFLRKNCLSCHGPKGPSVVKKTTHPGRVNCLQCHVPEANKEF